jgi:hypothetical protein
MWSNAAEDTPGHASKILHYSNRSYARERKGPRRPGVIPATVKAKKSRDFPKLRQVPRRLQAREVLTWSEFLPKGVRPVLLSLMTMLSFGALSEPFWSATGTKLLAKLMTGHRGPDCREC